MFKLFKRKHQKEKESKEIEPSSKYYVDIEAIVNEDSTMELYTVDFQKNAEVLHKLAKTIGAELRHVAQMKYVILYEAESEMSYIFINMPFYKNKAKYRYDLAVCYSHLVLCHLTEEEPMIAKLKYAE